jgi:hypothetical protein
LDIDVSLTMSNEEDLPGCTPLGENLDVVGNVFSGNLRITQTPSWRGEPSDIVSGSIYQRSTPVGNRSGLNLPLVGQDTVVWSRTPSLFSGASCSVN